MDKEDVVCVCMGVGVYRLIDYSEQTGGYQRRGSRGREDKWNRWGRLRDTNFQLYNRCHGDVMYSIGNIITNIIIILYDD